MLNQMRHPFGAQLLCREKRLMTTTDHHGAAVYSFVPLHFPEQAIAELRQRIAAKLGPPMNWSTIGRRACSWRQTRAGLLLRDQLRRRRYEARLNKLLQLKTRYRRGRTSTSSTSSRRPATLPRRPDPLTSRLGMVGRPAATVRDRKRTPAGPWNNVQVPPATCDTSGASQARPGRPASRGLHGREVSGLLTVAT